LRYLGSGDTEPAELLPISVLREGDLDFDEFVGGADLPYPYRRVNGRVVSAYSVLPGLANVPVFAAADLLGVDLVGQRLLLSLVTASLLCAAASLFLYAALRNLGSSRGQALCFALVFALATCVWSVAARGMWQHGPSLLLLCLALALLSSEGGRVPWAGLALGLAVVTRPTNVLIALPLAAFVWARHRRAVLPFLALAAVPAGLIAVYSAAYLADPLAFGQAYTPGGFGGNVPLGLAGLLASPSRGLFVFSPVLLFSAAGAAVAVRRREPLPVALVAGTLLVLLLYSRWGMWWGGVGFGYRLLIELLPGLVVLLAIAWREVIAPQATMRLVFAVLLAASVAVHALGAFVYPSRFNENLDLEPGRLWSWKESELALLIRKLAGEAGAPPADSNATVPVPAVWWTPERNDDAIPGWLDASPGGRTVRGPLAVSGWARSAAGDVDVRLVFDDGRTVAPERYPRPDVSAAIPALGDASRAGFRAEVPAPSGPLRPRALVVEMRSPSGRVRRLGPIRFTWGP